MGMEMDLNDGRRELIESAGEQHLTQSDSMLPP